jgi:hypothetical protein
MNPKKLSRENARFGLLGLCRLIALLCLVGFGLSMQSAQAETKFDHDTTGFLLNGAHTRVSCETCHAYGIFRGTPTRCAGCHGQSGTIATTKKGPNHVQSSDTCDDCHTEFSWSNARMDHTAVTGTCLSCHNGVKAAGKTPNHVQSSDFCGDCHLTVAWAPARFNHSGITGSCYSCHNGTTATGKSNSHILSTNICEDCHHSTTAWLPATTDHSDVIGTCYSCHNGVIATGKSADHEPSSNNCNDCHSTTAWKPATG